MYKSGCCRVLRGRGGSELEATVMILSDDMKTDFLLPVLPTMARQDGMILF